MANPLGTRRGFWTFAILTWLLAMACNGGVALYEGESAGAMAFTFTLITAGVALGIWVVRRFVG